MSTHLPEPQDPRPQMPPAHPMPPLASRMRKLAAFGRGLARLDAWWPLLAIQHALHRLHLAVMHDYRHRDHIAIDRASLARRAARLRQAWTLFQRLERLRPIFDDNPVWGPWIRRLIVQAQRQSKESFLYLALKQEVAVIPFEQLNRFHSPECGFTIHRDQLALHPFPYLPDGVSISEALNPPHSRQKVHHHPGEERVILLSDDVHVSALAPDGRWTERVGKFGDAVIVSPHVYHQLANPNDHPTADFTVKGPILQLRIDTHPPRRHEEGLWILPAQRGTSGDATVFVHRLHGVATRLSHNGEAITLGPGEEPATEDLKDVDVIVLSVPPLGTSAALPVVPIYPSLQAVRVFPWPHPVPPEWNLAVDPAGLRGTVTLLDEAGLALGTATFCGGDVVTVTGSVGGQRVAALQIANHTPDRTILASFTVVVGGSPLVALETPEARDPTRVGHKAAGLTTLSSLANVPRGFAVTTDAFRRFLALHGLDLAVLTLDEVSLEWARAEAPRRRGSGPGPSQDTVEDIRRLAEAIRAGILGASPPPDLARPLAEAYRTLAQAVGDSGPVVCVRSSATAEDTREGSAAGQYESFLNVRGEEAVARAVLGCFASLYGERAVHYRNAALARVLADAPSDSTGVPPAGQSWRHAEAAMAVVVQRLVRPRASGVAFSVDPTLGPGFIRVSANWGLGESVVGGQVTPEAWWVDAEQDLIRGWSLGEKTRKVVPTAAGGTVWQDADPDERDRFALTDEDVLQLARCVRGIARAHAYAGGVDVEFAIDAAGVLHLLQVRPITGPPSGRRRTVVLPAGAHPPARTLRGRTVSPGAAVGRLRIARTPAEVEEGDIVVTFGTNPDWGVCLPRARALLTDVGDDLSHAAILSRELGIPSLVATGTGTKDLREWEGRIVTLDADARTLYAGALPLAERDDSAIPEGERAGPITSVDTTVAEGIAEIRARGRAVILDGIEWHARPPHALSRLQRALYAATYRQVGLKFGCPFTVLERDGLLYVKLDDNFGPRRVLAERSVNEWAALMAERDEAIRELLGMLEAPRADADWLEQFGKRYVAFNVWMSVSREFRTLTQIALDAWRARFAPDAWARLLLAATREQPIETREAVREYEQLLLQARAMNAFRRDADPEKTLEAIRHEAPVFYGQLQAHARRYKFPGLRADVRTPPPLAELVAALRRDLRERRPTVEPEALSLAAEIDRLDPEALRPDERAAFVRILRLAARAAVQMDNEHHYKARAHVVFGEMLLAAREELVSRGLLGPGADVFELRLEEVVGLLRA